LSHFTAYDVPAYAPRRPTRTWTPPEYLDWWPKSEVTAVEAEIQTESFWLDHRFRAYVTTRDVLRPLYKHADEPEIVLGLWLAASLRLVVRRNKPAPGKPLNKGVLPIARAIAAAAEHHLVRAHAWPDWLGGAAYVLPDQPQGFLTRVEPNLDAVTHAVVEQIVGVHEKHMLVVMFPKGPVIPNRRAAEAAAQALRELTDEQFIQVVQAEGERRSRQGVN
jgi:hypothetical protein